MIVTKFLIISSIVVSCAADAGYGFSSSQQEFRMPYHVFEPRNTNVLNKKEDTQNVGANNFKSATEKGISDLEESAEDPKDIHSVQRQSAFFEDSFQPVFIRPPTASNAVNKENFKKTIYDMPPAIKAQSESKEAFMVSEEMDYASASVESAEDTMDMDSLKRHTRQSKISPQVEDLKERLTSLFQLPKQINDIATVMNEQSAYLQGGSSFRLKRQLGTPVIETVNNILGTVGDLTDSILGPLQSDSLANILAAQPTSGLLGGLLNTVLGSQVGESILTNLLGAVTNLINQILNLLRGLLGLATVPSLPGTGTGTETLASQIALLLSSLTDFQQLAGNLTSLGNSTGGNTTNQQFCFTLDGSGNFAQPSSLINISPSISIIVNILGAIFQSSDSTSTGSTPHRICVIPDANGSFTQIAVDQTILQRNNLGLINIINLSPTIDVNLLIGLIPFLNTGIISPGGITSDLCFNVDSSGTLVPAGNTGSPINVDLSIVLSLNILTTILHSRPPSLVSDHTQTICIRPGQNGNISQIIVNGNPINPSSHFSLLNLDFNLSGNLNILSNLLQKLGPGGNTTNIIPGGTNTKQICFDIPIPSGSGSLINISTRINININILSTLLGSGGRTMPQTSSTRRICVPIHIPNPTTTTTARPMTTVRPTLPPIKRCYKKICKHCRGSDRYTCRYYGRNNEPEYKIVYTPQ